MHVLARIGVIAGLALPAACAASPFDDVAQRFKYRIPFEIGLSEMSGDDRVEIEEVWGTRPEIGIGGDYLVRGRYRLSSHAEGRLFLYQTADGWDNTWYDTDLLWKEVARGEGTFALLHSLPGPGYLHVSLYGTTRDEFVQVANVYFGSGETLLLAERARALGVSASSGGGSSLPQD